jgi:hypothetical protein
LKPAAACPFAAVFGDLDLSPSGEILEDHIASGTPRSRQILFHEPGQRDAGGAEFSCDGCEEGVRRAAVLVDDCGDRGGRAQP